MVIEIATTHRVYRKEWLTEFVAVTEEEAKTYAAKFDGRLHEGDLKIVPTGKTWTLFVHQWNAAFEFKRESLAAAWREALIGEGADPEELRTVERNSRAETLLKNYGVLLLPKS